MGGYSIYDDMSDRQDVFYDLLQKAVDDEDIDNDKLAKLFDGHSGSVNLYISTGWNGIIDRLKDDPDPENQAFLNSDNGDGFTLIFIIENTLI